MAMKARPRLGRGLSSLISVSTPEEDYSSASDRSYPEISDTRDDSIVPGLPPSATEPDDGIARGGVSEIPLDLIVPNPHQPRREMNEKSIADLAASLKTTGLIQPIIVRKAGEQYELIAGERRWRAAKVAGLATVPAIVREANSFEQAQMALVENIQREDLNPIDRAQAYFVLMNQLGLTQAELASRIGEERSSIANYLRLLDLTPAVQSMVVAGGLSLGHAKIIVGIPDTAEQERLANLVVTEGLSVRNLERTLEEVKPEPTAADAAKAEAESTPSAHLLQLEKSLSQQLGLRVQLKASSRKGRGKLILHYSSLDQFDELVNRLGVQVES
jgi:ParB family chromosome partitioning protein